MLQIGKGLEYFKGLAATSRPKVVALRDAVIAGNLESAKSAYIKSRNEYEQIEVLAPGFPNIDCSIDCRACALFSASILYCFGRRFDFEQRVGTITTRGAL
jgi:hypothetical protein